MQSKDGTGSIWAIAGKDKYYEHYRVHTNFQDLKKWVDDAHGKLLSYLDKDWVNSLRNVDFYSRLWELEVAEWLELTGLKLIPTNGKGPDFCIELDNGLKIWIEAVLGRADEELEQIQRDALASKGRVYNTPRNQTALRFSSVLLSKADKIKEKYSQYISNEDYTLIAVSAYAPGAMRADIDLFMLGVLPIEFQIVHFSSDDKPLDESVSRPSHTIKHEHVKRTGAVVKKEFLYPGEEFPHIDGILFSEASNLQTLLGVWSSNFNASTNTPHIFERYKGKKLPPSFTEHFYLHRFRDIHPMVSLELTEPVIKH